MSDCRVCRGRGGDHASTVVTAADRGGAAARGGAQPLVPSAGRRPSPPPAGYLAETRQAATAEWVRALPVGNGRLGAMVFGGVAHERLQLNEDTLWAGRPVRPGQS